MTKLFLKRLLGDQSGATAVEYGLIVATIFLGMLLGIAGYVDATTDLYTTITNRLAAAMPGGAS